MTVPQKTLTPGSLLNPVVTNREVKLMMALFGAMGVGLRLTGLVAGRVPVLPLDTLMDPQPRLRECGGATQVIRS